MNESDDDQQKTLHSVTSEQATAVERGKQWIRSTQGQAELSQASRDVDSVIRQIQAGSRSVSQILKQRIQA